MRSFQQRVDEIHREARRLGIQLPMSAEEIVKWESQGHIVDLETGNVQWLQADRQIPQWQADVLRGAR